MKALKKIYLCGPTVYNHIHIGNLRPIYSVHLWKKSFEIINNEKIFFLHNITDIDDKIILKAQEENKTTKEISEFFYKKYLDILNLFNIDTVDKYLHVTNNVKQMYDDCQELVDKGFAYWLKDDIYAKIDSNSNYGIISNTNLINNSIYSKDNRSNIDFVIWKKNRPGWHLECYSLIKKETKGIPLFYHFGGNDLKFPHHENEAFLWRKIYKNEISENWFHFGMITFQDKKMSKSLNNLVRVRDYILDNDFQSLKLFFLSGKPQSPINFNINVMSQYNSILKKGKIKINQFRLNNKVIESSFIKYDYFKDFLFHVSKFNFPKALFIFIDLISSDIDLERYNNLLKIWEFLSLDQIEMNISKYDLEQFKEYLNLKNQKNYTKSDKIFAKLINRNILFNI